MWRTLLAVTLSVCMALGTGGWSMEALAQASAPKASTPDQQAMDKLLAPIALYPDALLAQVLACAASPEQVTDVNKWLKQNSQLQGTPLQEAAETAGFDASFISLVLFPDVLALLGQNMEWTTELGKAFTSDQAGVLASTQRLRAQAQAAGNLKTTPQQEVRTETQDGQTVIIVQPANPQVVYVPQYDPQAAYVAPPPAPAPAATESKDDSGKVVAAAVIGFVAGIALGAAMSNNYYYGWGAWGMHWHSHVVVVRGGAWRVPPGRYRYARPVPGYRPNTRVNAPRYNNVNINVNNTNINRQNNINNVNSTRTPRPTTASAASTRSASAPRATSTSARSTAGTASRGYAQTATRSPSATASPAGQMQRGASTSAFSGYQRGSAEKAASSRGRKSAGSSRSRARPR